MACSSEGPGMLGTGGTNVGPGVRAATIRRRAARDHRGRHRGVRRGHSQGGRLRDLLHRHAHVQRRTVGRVHRRQDAAGEGSAHRCARQPHARSPADADGLRRQPVRSRVHRVHGQRQRHRRGRSHGHRRGRPHDVDAGRPGRVRRAPLQPRDVRRRRDHHGDGHDPRPAGRQPRLQRVRVRAQRGADALHTGRVAGLVRRRRHHLGRSHRRSRRRRRTAPSRSRACPWATTSRWSSRSGTSAAR